LLSATGYFSWFCGIDAKKVALQLEIGNERDGRLLARSAVSPIHLSLRRIATLDCRGQFSYA
jgi:hypothetical protein